MGYYLVTGAAGGMGKAVTQALISEGHSVLATDVSLPDYTEAENLRFVRADIRKQDSVSAAFEIAKSEAGELDGIVCLAGVYDLNSLVEMSEDNFVRDFDVNLFGVFRVCRTFFPMLKRNGCVVIVSSELAPLDPLPFTGIYAITKSALDSFASALRAELQLLGIRVITVRPGAVRTDMLPASVGKMSEFCEKTELYGINATKFRSVVEKVEARSIPAGKIAALITKILSVKKPRSVYSVNRNPLLLILNALPRCMRDYIIRKILS